MKKNILNIIIFITMIIMIIGIISFFDGSMELYPTDEQLGKSRIISVIIIIICLIVEIVVVRLKRKLSLKEK